MSNEDNLTEEEYLARKRQLERTLETRTAMADLHFRPSFQSHGLDKEQLGNIEKMAFNANLPLTIPDHVPLFNPDAYFELLQATREGRVLIEQEKQVEQRTAKRMLPLRIMDDEESSLWAECIQRDERGLVSMDIESYRTRVDFHPSYMAMLRDVLIGELRQRFVHMHKGKLPKRGNPWRSK